MADEVGTVGVSLIVDVIGRGRANGATGGKGGTRLLQERGGLRAGARGRADGSLSAPSVGGWKAVRGQGHYGGCLGGGLVLYTLIVTTVVLLDVVDDVMATVGADPLTLVSDAAYLDSGSWSTFGQLSMSADLGVSLVVDHIRGNSCRTSELAGYRMVKGQIEEDECRWGHEEEAYTYRRLLRLLTRDGEVVGDSGVVVVSIAVMTMIRGKTLALDTALAYVG